MTYLIVTNGDNAARRIEKLKIADTVLSWRDVLHDGPVPLCESLQEQSRGRAMFIAGFAGLTEGEVLADFKQRDDILLNAPCDARIELWFEHDLYDQLQVMQIIHVLSHQCPDRDIYLVQSDDYLSEMAQVNFETLGTQAVHLTDTQCEYASRAWQAFCAKTPFEMMTFLMQPPTLPFIHRALKRLLREYNDVQTGLPLSLFNALSLLKKDKETPLKALFRHMQDCEEAKFMGDLSFAHLIGPVLKGDNALLKGVDKSLISMSQNEYQAFFDQRVTLTPLGEDVLQAKQRYTFPVDMNKWIGGVLCNSYYFDSRTNEMTEKDTVLS